MIDDLTLPTDPALQKKPKALPPEVYLEWVIANVRHLHETGRLDQIRNSPARRPADVPFALP